MAHLLQKHIRSLLNLQMPESHPDTQRHNLWGVSLEPEFQISLQIIHLCSEVLQTTAKTLSLRWNQPEEAVVSRRRGRLPTWGARQREMPMYTEGAIHEETKAPPETKVTRVTCVAEAGFECRSPLLQSLCF